MPEGNYTLDLTPAGDPDTVVASYIANLDGLGGAAAVVFASGFLTATSTLDSFGLYAALPSGDVVMLPPSSVPSEATS